MATALIRLSRIAAFGLRSRNRPLRAPQRCVKHLRPFPSRRIFAMARSDVSYLGQQEAAALDEDLMGQLKFSVDQLMELAGLSVATAISCEYSPDIYPRVLVIAGPGNNGGDGLVAARHLTHFGHRVELAYPIPTNKQLYDNLLSQCMNLAIPMCRPDVFEGNRLKEKYDLVVDAIFGFSFKGQHPRPPFDRIIAALKPGSNPPKIVSVDIPSGWNVEAGDTQGDGIRPDMLISLSAPKKCAQFFEGPHHYLGGRFIPPGLVEKFQLKLPAYPSSSQCVKLGQPRSSAQLQSMRVQYDTGGLDESTLAADPLDQFKIWFDEYSHLGNVEEPNAMVLATCGDKGVPSARCVLLKGLEHGGFVFYSNYDSKKGTQLQENTYAALCFYMNPLHRQIRVEGVVNRLSDAESSEYFARRPRDAQVGAWASHQSSVISSRSELDSQLQQVEARFADADVPIPRPPYWGGFVVVPLVVEFWQGRKGRLHDRCEYHRVSLDEPWQLRRLSP